MHGGIETIDRGELEGGEQVSKDDMEVRWLPDGGDKLAGWGRELDHLWRCTSTPDTAVVDLKRKDDEQLASALVVVAYG